MEPNNGPRPATAPALRARLGALLSLARRLLKRRRPPDLARNEEYCAACLKIVVAPLHPGHQT